MMAFPHYQTIAATLSGFLPELWWRLDWPNPANPGVGNPVYKGDVKDATFSIPPVDRPTFLVAFLPPDLSREHHAAFIVAMLVAVGYAEPAVWEPVTRHINRDGGAVACLMPEQVLVETYAPGLLLDKWVTQLATRAESQWWQAPSC